MTKFRAQIEKLKYKAGLMFRTLLGKFSKKSKSQTLPGTGDDGERTMLHDRQISKFNPAKFNALRERFTNIVGLAVYKIQLFNSKHQVDKKTIAVLAKFLPQRILDQINSQSASDHFANLSNIIKIKVRTSFENPKSRSRILRNSVIIICAWYTADIAALFLDDLIPEAPVVKKSMKGRQDGKSALSSSDVQIIINRNLFNLNGLIPGEGNAQGIDPGGVPIKTTLPLGLIGTIIFIDAEKSVATLDDKQAGQIYPVRKGDEVPGKMRIIEIQSRKVIFLNLAASRREYVEMAGDGNAPRVTISAKKTDVKVEQTAPNSFVIARTEIDKAMGDLNSILTQARCVPHLENGQPSGFQCFQIQAGSIYDKIGLKNNDILCGINGEPINDPGKAFEMLSELKTAKHLELCIKRDGRQNQISYDIQ